VNTARVATNVGELSGVFFHVGAFNVHTPQGVVIEFYFDGAIKGNGFVVLAN
jgi:hypothetical protein